MTVTVKPKFKAPSKQVVRKNLSQDAMMIAARNKFAEGGSYLAPPATFFGCSDPEIRSIPSSNMCKKDYSYG